MSLLPSAYGMVLVRCSVCSVSAASAASWCCLVKGWSHAFGVMLVLFLFHGLVVLFTLLASLGHQVVTRRERCCLGFGVSGSVVR